MGISSPKLEIPNERSQMTFYAPLGLINYWASAFALLCATLPSGSAARMSPSLFLASGYRDIPAS
jgi:hypothetical protein